MKLNNLFKDQQMNQEIIQKIRKSHERLFEAPSMVVRSPGRVNIIGEHTDYNEGFVLPAAIDKAAYVTISRYIDNRIGLYSEEFGEVHKTSLTSLRPDEKHWPNYILGVADQLVKRGYPIGGFNLVLDADVPIGAGLSSSAAIECATLFALNELFQLKIPTLEMVKIAQKAEQEFAGVMVGIMDMFASMHGKKNHLIKLDCRSHEFEYVPLKMDGIRILLLNTNVKHSLASSAYNQRRKECEQGAAEVKKHHPEVASLRDVTVQQLQQYVKDPVILKRCKYVVEENERLLSGCAALQNGDVATMGKKMFASHDGLSREYEVSCPELDFLVDQVRNHPDVLGARMMGGGFGGCTINLVKEEAIDKLIPKISEAYSRAMKKELTPYVASIEAGTEIVRQ